MVVGDFLKEVESFQKVRQFLFLGMRQFLLGNRGLRLLRGSTTSGGRPLVAGGFPTGTNAALLLGGGPACSSTGTRTGGFKRVDLEDCEKAHNALTSEKRGFVHPCIGRVFCECS